MRVSSRLLKPLRVLVLVALAAGSAAITASSLAYFGDDLAPFVLEKLPLPLEDVWMLALRTHVVAASMCLPGCLLLSLGIVVRRPRLHRWLGRVTGCAYLGSSQVFVKRGNEYRPAAFLLGKNLKAAAETTCQPAQDQLAHKD